MCILEIEKEQVKDELKDQQMSPPPTPCKMDWGGSDIDQILKHSATLLQCIDQLR